MFETLLYVLEFTENFFFLELILLKTNPHD